MTTLYNCRHDGDQYRVTKFHDGEVQGSYLVTHSECTCPAGSRPTCRHRQMLPEFIDRHLVNSHLFWNHDDGGFSCDFEGNPARETVAAGLPAEEDTEGLGKVMRINFPPDFKIEQTVDLVVPAQIVQPTHPWRRI